MSAFVSDALFIKVSIISVSNQSSLSTKLIHSPTAFSKPIFRAELTPPLGLWNVRTRGVGGGVLVADSAAAVTAAVVDEEELEVGEGLGEDGVDAAAEPALGIIYRNYDGNNSHRCYRELGNFLICGGILATQLMILNNLINIE